jgi:UDP-glucose 4-epimerase
VLRKILITGGAGFIGSHLVARWRAAHPHLDIVVLDNFRTGHERNLAGLGARLVRASVSDRAAVAEAAEGCDYIFHLAAMVSVVESMQHPLECIDVNVGGTLAVLEAARRHGVRKVVLSSSCAVYGDEECSPKREDMRPAPLSPYAITKLDGEFYLQMYARDHGVPSVSLRYFNVFGPRQDPSSPYAAVIPIFIERAHQGQDLVIYGDGGQTRDFVYVDDVVAANVLAAETAMSGVYNVARGEAWSIRDLAERIVAATRSTSCVRHEPERGGEVRHSLGSVERLRAAGFSPSITLDEGLRRTIDAMAAPATS